MVAGVLGVYGLCRRNFDLDIAASIFAGFAYGVLFFREIFFLSAVPGYLPLTVLALSHLLDNKSDVRWWLGLAGAGFLIAETSFITRLVPWPVITYAVWFLIVERRRRFSDWAIIILFSAAIMAARWQDITALLAYAPLSVLHEIRSSADLATVMAQFIQSLSNLVSHKHFISGGLLVLFGGAFRVERPAGGIRILFALAAVIVLFLLASLTKVAAASLWPFLSSFNVAYILQGFHLFAVIAGGIGFQFVTRLPGRAQHPERPLIRVAAILPAALFAILVAVNVEMKVNHIKAWLSWGNIHQNSQSPDMLKLAADIRARNSPVRAMSFQMHGTLLNSYGIETMAGYHPMVLRRYHEYWSKMTEPWREMEDWKSEFGRLEQGAVLSILPFAGTSRTKGQSQWELGKFVRINMLSLANGGYVVSRDVLTDDRLIKVSGPRRPWNSLSQEEKTLNHLKANFTGKRHHYLYRNPDVLPRAFTVNRMRVLESGSAVLNALSRADIRVLAETVFFEAGHHPQNQPIEGPLSQTDVEISLQVV